MAGMPMTVTCRVNPVSAAIGRWLIKVSHVAMIDLPAAGGLVPEPLPQDRTPERLRATLAERLTDPAAAQRRLRGGGGTRAAR